MTTPLHKAAQMALSALEEAVSYTSCPTWSPSMTEECNTAAAALRAALAAPQGEPVARVAGLDLCEFDDECDFCGKPEGRVFASISHNAEDCTETDFYVCEKCIGEAVYARKRAAAPVPERNCLTCLCEGLPIVIAGVEVDRCVGCTRAEGFPNWRAK